MAKIVWKREVLEKIIEEQNQALLKVGFQLEREIKQIFKKGTGNIYLKGKNRDIIHQASAPGEPPAVDIGRLRASISTNWTGSGIGRGRVDSQANPEEGVGDPGGSKRMGGQFKVVVGTNVRYAPWLEFGTTRMEKRPFMRPSLDRIKNKVTSLIKRYGGG